MKSLRRFAFMFMGIGGAMLVGSMYWASHKQTFIDSASRAQGVVVELVEKYDKDGSTWAPRVRYTSRDGTEYSFIASGSSNPPSFSEGERVEVLYDPQNPTGAEINTYWQLWGGMIILGVLGSVFALIGAGVLVAPAMVRQRTDRLKATGRRILADYQGAQQNTSLTVDGRHPYRLLAQWHDPSTKMVYVFTSENIWFNPEAFVDQKQLTVYLDPKDYRKYYVDVSFLPAAAG